MSFSLPTGFSKSSFGLGSKETEKDDKIVEDSQPEREEDTQEQDEDVDGEIDEKSNDTHHITTSSLPNDEKKDNEDAAQNEEDDALILRTTKIRKSFNREQEERYGCYRRSSFKKMKSVLSGYAGINANPTMNIVVSGIAKLYVGELIETAKGIQEKWKESGPIQPRHLREAQRILERENKVPMKPKPRIIL